MKANYTITTDVKKSGSNENIVTSLRVFILVDSKSNLVPQYIPLYINTEEQFFFYFSDNMSEYSDSLRTAYRLINAGYTLLVINVRNCENLLTGRLYQDGSMDYFFNDIEDSPINSTLVDDKDLAVKISLPKFRRSAYILLEQRIRGVQSNLLIYSHDNVPLSYNSYQKRIYLDPSMKTEEKCEYLYNELMRYGYFAKMSKDKLSISIASPCSFTSIGIYYNCTKPEFDPQFETEYKERVKYNNQLVDFKSTYTSDLEDLELKIFKEGSDYNITVTKYSNDKIHTTEVFTGPLLDVLAEINYRSLFLRVNYSEEIKYLLTGVYKLKSFPTNEEVLDNNYEIALETLYEYKESEKEKNKNLDIRANIVYEPDIYSIRSQTLISEIFDNENIPVVKLFNYLNNGEEFNTQQVAYFDTCYYSYNGEKFTTKELLLKFLIERKLDKKFTDIYKLGEKKHSNYPAFVNELEQVPDGFNVTSICCLYNKKRFNILELLSLSMVNSLVIEYDKNSITSFYSAIDVTNRFFSYIMDYKPNIELAYYIKDNDRVYSGFYYTVNNPEELKVLELNLKV